ncbi:hypothetical protein ABZP36_023337 [Zizania latifolia]
MDWVMRLPVGARGVGVAVDALVVAGDVAETWDNFARTMAALRERFGAIFYVPGNHDLWLHRENGRYVSGFLYLLLLLSLLLLSLLALHVRCLTKCLGIVIQVDFTL